MKHIKLLCFLMLFANFSLKAQVEKMVNLTTAGTLSSVLTTDEKSTITNLTVTGNIDQRDFVTMNTMTMNNTLFDINLYNANIEAYNTYPANTIPERAFQDAMGGYKLANIILPKTTTTIGAFAFYGCSKLKLIQIPNTVTSIGNYAFSMCNKLEVIKAEMTTLPTIGSDVFTSVPGSCKLLVPFSKIDDYKGANQWSVFATNTFAGIIQVDNCTVGDLNTRLSIHKDYIYNLTINGNIDKRDLDTINSIYINKALTCIDLSEANIKEYTDPQTSTIYKDNEIPSYFISNSNNSISIKLPNSLKVINKNAFSFCSIESINIPNSVENIFTIFDLCAIKKLSVDINNANYCSENDVLFNKSKTRLIKYPIAKDTDRYEIPNSVEILDTFSLTACIYLKYLTIPSSVTTIKYGAIAEITTLDSIKCYKTTPPALENNAFSGTTNATTYCSIGSEAAYTTAGYPNVVGLFPNTPTIVNEQRTLNKNVKIYPNPTTDKIYIEVEEETLVSLFNQLGQRVRHKIVSDKENIEVSGLPKGLYILKVGTKKEKIIIE